MKIPLKYSGKTIYITPFDTKAEKDILLFSELTEEPDLLGIMTILEDYISGDTDNLTRNEILGVLWKIRSLSVGEEIGVKWVCEGCKTTQDGTINISEVVQGKDCVGITDIFEPVTPENLGKFVDVDVDELEILEFDELLKKVTHSITQFNLIKEAKCLTCGKPQRFDISNDAYISAALSEDSIQSIYQTISDLVFFGKYTKADVDGMLPFERSIFVGLLNKTREDLNK